MIIDSIKLENDHYVQYKGTVVKYQYSTGETFNSNKLSFFNDAVYVAIKDTVEKNGGASTCAHAI